MPQFQGTTKEFHRYVGPRIRNLVQTITKGYRKDLGKCENKKCLSTEKLEAAHIHGKGRQKLIIKALDGFISGDNIDVDLTIFEEKFKDLHYPLNETIKIFCNKCHTKYDRKVQKLVAEPELKIEKTQAEKEETKTLPIRLKPRDKELFKQNILRIKKANIFIHYKNGKVVNVDWDASNLKDQSNIFGNLRSRPEFRQGNWQKKGIKSVVVKA